MHNKQLELEPIPHNLDIILLSCSSLQLWEAQKIKEVIYMVQFVYVCVLCVRACMHMCVCVRVCVYVCVCGYGVYKEKLPGHTMGVHKYIANSFYSRVGDILLLFCSEITWDTCVHSCS